jgi:ATP synthase protein I
MVKPNNDLDNRLQAALQRERLIEAPTTDNGRTDMSGLAYGMRLALEFLGGTLVGMGIGYGIDRYFDSLPWGLMIFTLFGFGAGTLNMYRLANQIDDTIGSNRTADRTSEKPAPDLTKTGQTGTPMAGDNPSDNSI